jgi:hypothetical protein
METDPSGHYGSGTNPLEKFSLRARMVIVFSLVAGVAGIAGYISWMYDDLSPRRYPVMLFAVPVFLIAGLLCLAARACCERAVFRFIGTTTSRSR